MTGTGKLEFWESGGTSVSISLPTSCGSSSATLGAGAADFLVFVVSGLIHDLVISGMG
jgi:hypothetical protein